MDKPYCTTAALKALQAIKESIGGDLDAFNEVRLNGGRFAFFECGEEQADGAIVGTIRYRTGGTASFRINADGTIARFPGLRKFHRKKIEWLATNPRYRPTVAVMVTNAVRLPSRPRRTGASRKRKGKVLRVDFTTGRLFR